MTHEDMKSWTHAHANACVNDMMKAGIPEVEARSYLEKAMSLARERAIHFEHDARTMLSPETYQSRGWAEELLS